MKIVNVVQGTPEWHAHRENYFGASEAPAMMGVSPYQTRDELLQQKSGLLVKEFDSFTQDRFARGHQAEAAARPSIELMLGEDLYPATGVSEKHPRLSASFDGITMDGKTGYECKLWNEELVAAVRAGQLTPAYYWQLEHQCLVGNLDRVIFAVSDEEAFNLVYMEYRPVPGRREQLIAGWDQFEKDLAEYKPREPVVEVVGKNLPALPALTVHLVGEVKASNLALYKTTALDFIASINTDLKTDQDFADAEKAVKFCDAGEKELELVKSQALAQTRTIDDLFRAIDEVKESMRQKRLTLEKAVKNRKEAIRVEILQAAQQAFAEHVQDIAKKIAPIQMPTIQANFAEAMKGKKTITGLRDGVDTEMARVKIEATRIGDGIKANLTLFNEIAAGYEFLFRDQQQLMLKDSEAMTAIVKGRIAEHKAAEEAKKKAEQERIERETRERVEREERERIAAEEKAKLLAQQEAERLAQGEVPARLAPEPVPAPAQTVAPAGLAPRASVAPAATRPARPTDAQIIAALALHYRVHESKVIEWLLAMDLEAESRRLEEQPF